MNIELHIERLVLEGLKVERRHAGDLQAAFETELSRLLVDGGLAPSLTQPGQLRSVDAAPIRADGAPAEIGGRVAHSLYGGLGR